MAFKRKYHRDSIPNEGLVSQSLHQIASILVRLGLDARSAEKLLRRAFIGAAHRALSAGGEKATQSQIASIAGVSRLEVRRCLSRHSSTNSTPALQSNSRLKSVLAGWHRDANFLTKSRKPRSLTYHGSASEFAALVRKYGRDVTPKTLRIQMLGRGFVTERNGRLSVRAGPPQAKREAAATADLRYIVSQLENIDFELGRRAYLTRNVAIDAFDKKTTNAMHRIASSRLDAALSAISTLSKKSASHVRRAKAGQHRLLVRTTIAVETEEDE